jgi:hypothetical protein
MLFILDVGYGLYVTWIVHQHLWGYKVEEKLRMGVREQKRLNAIGLCLHSDTILSSKFITV